MQARHLATWMLEQEARALLTRLDRVKPFALQETMLPAAALSPAAQTGIEQYLIVSFKEEERIKSTARAAACVSLISAAGSPLGRRLHHA